MTDSRRESKRGGAVVGRHPRRRHAVPAGPEHAAASVQLVGLRRRARPVGKSARGDDARVLDFRAAGLTRPNVVAAEGCSMNVRRSRFLIPVLVLMLGAMALAHAANPTDRTGPTPPPPP